MIQHIVMMKFADAAGPAERAECLRRMQELPEHVDFLGQYQAGADELQGSRSWDVGLVSVFGSVLAFRDHPAHQAAQEFTSPYISGMASVDFTIAGPESSGCTAVWANPPAAPGSRNGGSYGRIARGH
jgi:Stress responsive A/B Barrel Domain